MAIILKCALWGSEWTLWLDKHKGIADDRERADLATGKRLEAAIIGWANEETGAQGRPWIRGTPSVHPEYPWLRGSPDAWLYNEVGCEAKVSADYPWDEVPAAYQAQCRVYMAIFNCESWVVAVFFRRAPAWRLYRVYRDAGYEDNMIDRAGEWWERHVVAGEPPEIDGTHAAAVGLGHIHGAPKDREGFRVATHDEVRDVEHYNDVDKTVKRLEVDRDRLGNQLRDAVGPAQGIRWTGGKLRWSRGKTQRAGRLILNIDE